MGMETRKPITVEAAAGILGVVPDHVRLLIRRGRIEAARFSNVWLVDPESVRNYLTSGRTPTKGRPRKKKATRKKKGAR
jgi:excisionase family DNA binding protein